jgi:hypothetical protein
MQSDPYHLLGLKKYSALGKEYRVDRKYKQLTKEDLTELNALAEKYNIESEIL